MPLIDKSEAVTLLEPHLEHIYEAVTGGWKDYVEGCTERLRAIQTKRSTANIVHACIVARATKVFGSMNGIKLHDVQGLFLVQIGEVIFLRFKKFDEALLSKNQPTKQVHYFRGQIPFPGFKPVHHLEAGYVFDDLLQKIVDVEIVCPNGKRNYWNFPVSEPTRASNIQDLFSQEPEPTTTKPRFSRRTEHAVNTQDRKMEDQP